MRQRADQTVSGVSGQLSIRIESNHIANLRQDRQIANLHRKTVGVVAEKPVQVKQLAAFSLPSHPSVLRGVVHAMTVKVEERAFVVVSIFFIQVPDERTAQLYQMIAFVKSLGGVGRICQQREMQIGVTVSQISNFQRGSDM